MIVSASKKAYGSNIVFMVYFPYAFFIHLQIETAFLSELDSKSIRNRLFKKVKAGEKLSEDELMEFIT